jgi:hypothetical protein
MPAAGGVDPAMMSAYSAQMAAAMATAQAQMSQAGAAGAGMPAGGIAMPPGMPMAPGAAGPGEAAGKALEISADLGADLKKGKTIVRNIDWIAGGEAVSTEGADAFTRGLTGIAAAMAQAGSAYRLDLYMDKQSGDAVVRTLGPRRLAAVQQALLQQGAPDTEIGKSKKDKDPRLEIVKLE